MLAVVGRYLISQLGLCEPKSRLCRIIICSIGTFHRSERKSIGKHQGTSPAPVLVSRTGSQGGLLRRMGDYLTLVRGT